MTPEMQIAKDWEDILERFGPIEDGINQELREINTPEEFEVKEKEILARFGLTGYNRTPCSLSFTLVRHQIRIEEKAKREAENAED